MSFFKGKRQPLDEGQFLEAGMAEFFDEHARSFMGPVYRRLNRKVTSLNLNVNKVLDIGTGTGLLAVLMAKDKPEWQITGIDIAEDMLKIARQNAEKNYIQRRATFLQSPAETLPFPDNSFDLVVSNTSLHLWAQPEKVFNELSRVTAAGGRCIIWDNLRLARFNPIPQIISGVLRMNPMQRRLWLAAMKSAYTLKEARNLLKETTMKDAQASIISGLLMLEIDWRKPAL